MVEGGGGGANTRLVRNLPCRNSKFCNAPFPFLSNASLCRVASRARLAIGISRQISEEWLVEEKRKSLVTALPMIMITFCASKNGGAGRTKKRKPWVRHRRKNNSPIDENQMDLSHPTPNLVESKPYPCLTLTL
jgi:hypothetical protein